MTHVRIFGEKLSINDCFVDVTVDSIDIDGTVQLTEDVEIDPRSWTVDLTDLDQWREDDYAIQHANATDLEHTVWSGMSEVYDSASDSDLSKYEYEIKTVVGDLFTNVVDSMDES